MHIQAMVGFSVKGGPLPYFGATWASLALLSFDRVIVTRLNSAYISLTTDSSLLFGW